MLPAAPAPRRRPDARPEGAGRPGAARRNQPSTTEGGSPRQSAGGTAPAGQGRPRPPRPSGLFKITGWAAPASPTTSEATPSPHHSGLAIHAASDRPARREGRASTPPPTTTAPADGAGATRRGWARQHRDRPGRKAALGRRQRSREVPAPRPLPPPRRTGAGCLNRAPAGAHRFRFPAGIGSPWGAYGGTYRGRQRRPLGV